jgi:hypothetical protein
LKRDINNNRAFRLGINEFYFLWNSAQKEKYVLFLKLQCFQIICIDRESEDRKSWKEVEIVNKRNSSGGDCFECFICNKRTKVKGFDHPIASTVRLNKSIDYDKSMNSVLLI